MVKIIGDSTSGLSESFAQSHDIPIIPQIINIGDESYLEGVEITYETFLEKLKGATELPKTAAPPPELFTEVFERFAPSGESIICIVPSAVVSGTFRSATVGLKMAIDRGVREEIDVRIIDTQLIAGPVAALLRLASQWAEEGENVDTIEARVREMSARCRVYFMVDTLKHLAMGGRIGGAAALLGSVLQIKPVLTLREGTIDTFEKVRTHGRAVDRLKQLVVEQIAPGDAGHLSVMHAAAEDQAQALVDYFRDELGLTSIDVLAVPPAVVTHAGPGVLAVGFFTE